MDQVVNTLIFGDRDQGFSSHPYKAGGTFLPLVEPETASLPLVGVGLSTSQPSPYTVEDGIGTHNPWKTLLTEMEEGYYRNKGTLVLVIGATNRLWSLDEELDIFRHFHKTFRVDEPNEDCRQKMFSSYLKEYILEEYKEVICNLVAKSTPGSVWGDLQEIGDESTRLAARR
ncbi:ATPase, AAA-type, core, P-loop containing nucleoside triphosphate hydrolase, partial [Tanacetum coccineum]